MQEKKYDSYCKSFQNVSSFPLLNRCPEPQMSENNDHVSGRQYKKGSIMNAQGNFKRSMLNLNEGVQEQKRSVSVPLPNKLPSMFLE